MHLQLNAAISHRKYPGYVENAAFGRRVPLEHLITYSERGGNTA